MQNIKNNTSFYLSISLTLLIAIVIRLCFFNGALGSDDIVYLSRSIEIANGEWTSANYNGALRYGYNIPSGVLIYLFGLNLFTANLWPFICSISEVVLIFTFAWLYIGRNAAIFSALLLAFLPLHVAVSTRLHADAVVSMFLTLSFVAFYHAERQSCKLSYFIAGVALGCVFWTKELVAVTICAFLIYPFIYRKASIQWLYVVAGGVLMLLLHFALMQFIANDPLHAIKTVLGQVNKNFIGAGDSEDDAWYYFKYLFFDIKHTWLAPLFALIAILFIHKKTDLQNNALFFTLFWLISLLVVLSFFPVSLSPLKFTMKQSNYMTLFIAPICIIAGVAISTLNKKIAYPLLALTFLGGIVLSALEQQSYQAFTANSRALVDFSKNNPQYDIYGSANNDHMACFDQVLNRQSCKTSKIHDYSNTPAVTQNLTNDEVLVVIDPNTMDWGKAKKNIKQAPPCWKKFTEMQPASTGNGAIILELLKAVSAPISPAIKQKLSALEPKPATIYTTHLSNFWCQ